MDTQSDFETVLNGLGPAGEWNDRSYATFYKRFFQQALKSNSVILEVNKVEKRDQRVLLTASVLNTETLIPYVMPDSGKTWTVRFFHDLHRGFEKGNVLFAKVRKLRNMKARDDLVEVNTSAIRIAEMDETFIHKYGAPFVERLKKAFGSLEGVSDFIIEEFKSDVEEHLDQLQNQMDKKVEKLVDDEEVLKQNFEDQLMGLEDKLIRFKAENQIEKNKLIAEHEESEQRLKREHQVSLRAIEQEKASLQIREKKLTDEKNRLRENENELAEKKQELDHQKKMFEQYQAELQTQFDQCHLVNPLRQDQYENRQEQTGETLKWQEQENIAETIQGALFTQCELAYDRRVIEEFVACLHTDVFIILNGPSGTGKSSLVKAISEIIEGSVTKTIRVQSSWTDSQDLLGFFNPIDYQYIPTPFLDALLQAHHDQNQLYIINLDEMNLAHVEYYFAEILSAREEKEEKGGSPKLSLYAEHFMEIARKMIRPYVFIDENDREKLNTEKLLSLSVADRMRVQNCYDLIHKYPASFSLPDNVRFTGTMNMDQTVKGLSPKVIDRSFVLTVDHPNDRDYLYAELRKNHIAKKIHLSFNDDLVFPDVDSEVEKEYQGLNSDLEVLKARLNPRALKQIGRLSRVLPEKTAIESIITGKILPRIDVLNHPQAYDAFLKLKDILKERERVRTKMDDMVTGGNTITYWR